jgi:hypothetical protein
MLSGFAYLGDPAALIFRLTFVPVKGWPPKKHTHRMDF